MPKKNKNPLTANDIIATIKRSRVPSLVVEGNDDVIVYRRIEEEYAGKSLSIIPAGGRETVLKVFERRNEFPNHSTVIFIADLDFWVFAGVPADYVSSEMIFTDGYSIENDMFRDGDLQKLISASSLPDYRRELDIVCSWYALAVTRRLAGIDERVDIHPNELLDNPARSETLGALNPGEIFPSGTKDDILRMHPKLLRGKCLLGLLVRHLTSHSIHALLNFAASRRGPLFQRLSAQVGQTLAHPLHTTAAA